MYYLVGQKEETATLVYIERKEREQNKRRPLESRLCKENQRGFDPSCEGARRTHYY